jgi:hypothetical protein
MSKLNSTLTATRLREALDYDKETGLFTWLVTNSRRSVAGTIVGLPVPVMYPRIRVDKELYSAHILAWLHAYGKFPIDDIDHIDGNRNNNRLDNLRDVKRNKNMQNLRAPKSNNKIGMLGVSRNGKNGFSAKITVDGKYVHIGTFGSPELAHDAYLKAKRQLHPGCTI